MTAIVMNFPRLSILYAANSSLILNGSKAASDHALRFQEDVLETCTLFQLPIFMITLPLFPVFLKKEFFKFQERPPFSRKPNILCRAVTSKSTS